MKAKIRFSILLFTSLLMMRCGSSTENKGPATDSTASKPIGKDTTATPIESETPLDQNPSLKAEMDRLHEEWKSVPNPLIAKLSTVEMGDYFHLIFEDASGKALDFGNGDNDLGDLVLYDEKEMTANPKMLGKSFSITWEWKRASFYCCEGEMNSVTAKVPTITKIEAR